MRVLSALAVALLVSAPASAAPFGWTITGQFTTITDAAAGPFAGLFHLGQDFTLKLVMESSARESATYAAIPSCGIYNPITSATLSSGGVEITGGTGIEYIVRSPPGFCELPGPSDGLIRTGFRVGPEFFVANVFYEVAGDFATDSLPINPNLVTRGYLELTYQRAGVPFTFAYSNAIATAVPEPASLTLLGLGMIGLWRRRRP